MNPKDEEIAALKRDLRAYSRAIERIVLVVDIDDMTAEQLHFEWGALKLASTLHYAVNVARAVQNDIIEGRT